MGCNAGTVSLYASGDDGISSIDLAALYAGSEKFVSLAHETGDDGV